MKTIEKSTCCDADVKYVKGSYMGSQDTECLRCGRYCVTYKIKVPEDKIQKPVTRGEYGLLDTQT